MNRRSLIQAMLIGILSTPVLASANVAPVIEVFKSESCGCCTEWVNHLQKNGFTVKAKNVESPADYREKFGMPQELGSCHSGFVSGYAIEGHVPASEIKRLLAERPKAIGLAVPSMPLGSPGMEGERKDPYNVFLVHPGGKRSIYKHYNVN